MSSDAPIISLNRVWKKYTKDRIFHRSIREDMVKIFSNKPEAGDLSNNEFWALQDVSLEIRKGDVLALTGPNGAGKSTILKLIARVTYPNRGNVNVHGKIAPIIELGSGFHPDLTGRENILINGVLIGMTRKEAKEKTESIIDFAEIREFIDMPIKNYSSGMYLRLAFAIAVHSDADIFLFDEVVSVGDDAFKEKCFQKIEELRSLKKTIVFVNHFQIIIDRLATRVIDIHKGRVQNEPFLFPQQNSQG